MKLRKCLALLLVVLLAIGTMMTTLAAEAGDYNMIPVCEHEGMELLTYSDDFTLSFEDNQFTIHDHSIFITASNHANECEYQAFEPLQTTCCGNMVIRFVQHPVFNNAGQQVGWLTLRQCINCGTIHPM